MEEREMSTFAAWIKSTNRENPEKKHRKGGVTAAAIPGTKFADGL
jgi:hypothetical protein